MSDYNKIILIGRLTQAPELRFTPQGSPVSTLRVASSRKYRTKAGEEREETCFIHADVWGQQAENCAQYLVKGQRVLVDGELTMRDWESKAGEKKRTYEIRAARVVFMEKPRNTDKNMADQNMGQDIQNIQNKKGSTGAPARSAASASGSGAEPVAVGAADDDGDEIPF